MQAEVQVFSISDYCNEQLLDMTTKKLAVSSSDVVKIFDHLYEKHKPKAMMPILYRLPIGIF